MRTAFLLFVLLPQLAFAEGYSGANGTNKLGERIYIGDDGGDGVDTIYVFEKRTKSNKWKERYDLREECPSFFLWGKQFSCLKNGKSPLAGSTYQVTTSKKWKPCGSVRAGEFNGEVYVCIDGCNNPRAPKIFYVNPWECTS